MHMSKELDNKKSRTALNETRLLILGVQVLLGFEFQSFFQEGFKKPSERIKVSLAAGLFLVIVATGLLVIPSMERRSREGGQSTLRLIGAASFYAGLGLAPLTLSLGLSVYVVIARHFGGAIGAAIGITFNRPCRVCMVWP